VRLWDPANGARLRELAGHDDAINGLAWSPDGTELASGGDDRVVIIWNADSGSEVRRLEGRTALEVYQYHYAARGPNWIKSVAWSPDGKRLAAGSSDFVSRIWDPASGAELRLLEGPEVPVLSVAWASDSRHLALTGVGGSHSITVWHAMKDQPLYQLGGHVDTVYGLDWAPDGNRLASAGNDGVIHVWEVPLE
jgi:WD40 repeat protein